MSRAEIFACDLREQAMRVALSKGSITVAAPEQRTFRDARLRIEFWPGSPCAIDVFKIGNGERRVFGAIWNVDTDSSVTVVHQHGSWEDVLARVAKACV